MKKAYVKPEMFYENFDLSHTIASCSVLDDNTEVMASFHDKNQCYYDYFGMKLFADGNRGCTDGDPASQGQDYCYQTGSESYNYFCS